jgi:serine phosphatase RsbU (regulator of sigma subunit)
MTRKSGIIRAMTLPPAHLVRSLFRRRKTALRPADPRHSDVPLLRSAEIAAVYHSQRVAGDFYEFLRVGPSRVLFGLFDLAGRREDTREILIAAQNTFRILAPKLFAGKDFNEAEAMMGLCHEVNRTILQVAGSIRSCPAFIGCYNEDLGTVCYTNAGHTPALLRDHSGITQLEASGLPLGIFSHATQSASTCGLGLGAALLLVSRGIIEAEHNGQEFGLEGAKKSFQGSSALSAQDLCLEILQSAEQFLEAAPTHNDVTALVLLRYRDAGRPGSRSSGRKPFPYDRNGKTK